MSSGFITETELAEQRRTRQEEWEKVRKPDEPTEVPEEQYDHRSLFDRLEEQKNKRDLEYEETHKLKNMIRGLDDDEVDFLDLVEKSKMDAEMRTSRDEARELREYRDAVAKAEEASLDHRIKTEIKARPVLAPSTTNTSRSSQGRLLAGAVVRKRPANTTEKTPDKKARTASPTENTTADKSSPTECTASPTVCSPDKTDSEHNSSLKRKHSDDEESTGEVMKCIGILPGLGSYPDSSDSEASSDTDQELAPQCKQFDLLGRKIAHPKQQNASASH